MEGTAMTKQKRNNVLFFILMCLILVVYLIPVFFQVITAFKADKEISLMGFRWLPEKWTFDAFANAWKMANWPQAFANSVIMTVSVIVVCLSINLLAGYAFARLKFRGSDLLFIILLMGLMIPAQSIIIPQFIIVRSMGLYDTIWGSAICYLSAPMGVFLAKQFYLSFPKELDEAASLDGCSKFGTYIRVYLPLSTTIIATLTITKGTQVWNDFFYPLIMTTSQRNNTLQLCLQLFKGSSTTHFNWLMAAATVTSLPMVILYFSAQKYFVEGLQTTGMKN
ncbi:MAG: carbohydrate ABC transporter permease [Clostridia bacterium]|nr:carbohydrate ABC transporter permease [Clostridia bacterium]